MMIKSAALLRTASYPPVQPLTRTGIIPSSSSAGISFRPEDSHNRRMRRTYSVETDLMSPRLTRDEWLSESFGIANGNDSNDHGGKGNGNGKGKGGNNNSNNNNNKMGEYYKKMLKSNPGDPLLLSNYAKYLHQVENNKEKAEEYYGRAILEDPGVDGQVLSLFGSLIWETSNDEDRAQLYFDQAIHASPNDCMVLGSYAHFLWEAEDDDDEEDEEEIINYQNGAIIPAMVGVH